MDEHIQPKEGETYYSSFGERLAFIVALPAINSNFIFIRFESMRIRNGTYAYNPYAMVNATKRGKEKGETGKKKIEIKVKMKYFRTINFVRHDEIQIQLFTLNLSLECFSHVTRENGKYSASVFISFFFYPFFFIGDWKLLQSYILYNRMCEIHNSGHNP